MLQNEIGVEARETHPHFRQGGTADAPEFLNLDAPKAFPPIVGLVAKR
jgi:hypothetical protein